MNILLGVGKWFVLMLGVGVLAGLLYAFTGINMRGTAEFLFTCWYVARAVHNWKTAKDAEIAELEARLQTVSKDGAE